MADISIYEQRRELIGTRIRDMRRRSKLTQTKLAEKFDQFDGNDKDAYMSQSAVSGWENGATLPPLDRLVALASIFDCDIGYLLGDYDEPTRNATDIAHKMGLSPLAAENLDKIKNCSGGDDYWAIIIDYLSFLLEHSNTVLVPVAIGISKCINAKLEEAHYKKEVLPQLTIPADVEKKAINDFIFSDEYTDIEEKRTKVLDRIKQLTDIYVSNLYHCKENVSSAIEKFIIKETDKYG